MSACMPSPAHRFSQCCIEWPVAVLLGRIDEKGTCQSWLRPPRRHFSPSGRRLAQSGRHASSQAGKADGKGCELQEIAETRDGEFLPIRSAADCVK
jgi:hypothetical protein